MARPSWTLASGHPFHRACRLRVRFEDDEPGASRSTRSVRGHSTGDGRNRLSLCVGGQPSVEEDSVRGPPPTPVRGQREPRSSRPLDLPSGSHHPNEGRSTFGGWSRNGPLSQFPAPTFLLNISRGLQGRFKGAGKRGDKHFGRISRLAAHHELRSMIALSAFLGSRTVAALRYR